MKSFVVAILASMVLAGAAVAGNDDPQPENGCDHESECNGGSTVVDQSVRVRNTNTNTAVATSVSSADADARANQSQGQSQEQYQGNQQVLTQTYEDAKNPASSAANLFLANCSSGASGQGFGGGGSIGGPDEVCLLMNYAQVSAVLGDAEGSAWAMKEARNILKVRTNTFLRIFQALPVVRRIF